MAIPVITAIQPPSSREHKRQPVKVLGHDFVEPINLLTFGGENVTDVVVKSESEIRCTIPSQSRGKVVVGISGGPPGSGGSSVFANGYEFTPRRGRMIGRRVV